MRIGEESYLAVSSSEVHGRLLHTVEIRSSLAAVVGSWLPGTRVSPIFGLDTFSTDDPRDESFVGNHYLAFLGGIHPATLLELQSHLSDAWLTLGTFNVVARLRSGRHKSSLAKFCESRKLLYEFWHIQDGVIDQVKTSPRYALDDSWRTELLPAVQMKDSAALREALREYAPLMASAMARCERWLPAELVDLRSANTLTLEILKHDGLHSDPHEKLSGLVTLNAALSRFTSQTFSGTSPIFETECHYWIHSLLGTGTANLALVRIRDFVTRTLGAYNIPTRVEKYADVHAAPDLQKDVGAWHVDFLGATRLTKLDAEEPLFPLITYWSGRDNFKSSVNSLSAPLTAIFSCNSLRWTLMTITHELSHAIVRGVLSVLSFDTSDEEEASAAAALLHSGVAANDLLTEIRRAFLIAVLTIDEADALLSGATTAQDIDVRALLLNWNKEVDETLAHVFDFLYFYSPDWERYVSGIWLSWSAVPNLGERVSEYVLRTLTAMLARDFDNPDAPEIARADILRVLRTVATQLRASHGSSEYVDRAIDVLENDWESRLLIQTLARRDLARIVRSFLFSEPLATQVRSELGIARGHRRRSGYAFSPRVISTLPLRSPLKFIAIYTTPRKPSIAESVWMLMTIAQNYARNAS